MKLKLLKKLSRISSRGFSRFSRFSKVLTAFVYFSSLSSISYFATTENQVLHVYKDWTGLISGDVLSSVDVLSDDNIISSEPVSEDMADMAVSNDTPASSENDNEESESDSFDSFVSHDTNDTEKEADTEDSAEDSVDSGNTVGPVAPVPSGPDEENNDNTPNNENNENNPNNPDDSESIAVLTTRLTSDHHLIATLSISGVMGADVAIFPNTTGPDEVTASGPDEFTSAGGNIYTVSNNAGSSAVASLTDSADFDNAENVDKPDSLLLNFENEEGVVESVRLWLDNEIDETVILDGITATSDDSNTINTISNGNDNGSSSNDSNFSSRAADGSNSNRSSQPDQPRLAVPLSPVLSSSSSSGLAAISDTKNISDTATAPSVLGHTLESFIGLDQLASPIIVILPSTNEQYYFADGRALAAYDRFDQDYRISDIRATTRAEIEVRLVRK